MEQDAVKSETLAQLKDILAGSVAGVVSKVVEYPLDTLKVLMQVSHLTGERNVLHVFRVTIQEGGVRRMYRGLSAPVIGAAGENIVTFWMFGAAERKLKKKLRLRELTMMQIGYCGAFSGIGTGLWLTPVEFVKCQMQVASTAAKYNNSTWQCLKHNLVRKPSNLLIGLSATLLREVPGGFVYFVAYRGTSRFLQTRFTNMHDTNQTSSSNSSKNRYQHPPMWTILTAGGVAGISCWTAIYPIDLIKSRQQSLNVFESNITKNNHNHNVSGKLSLRERLRLKAKTSIIGLLVDRVRTYGFGSLYNGWSVAATRSVIANAIIFAGYEYSRKMLDQVIEDETVETVESDD